VGTRDNQRKEGDNKRGHLPTPEKGERGEDWKWKGGRKEYRRGKIVMRTCLLL